MSEKTTLLASKTTKQYLELVKDETGLQSYDEVIDFPAQDFETFGRQRERQTSQVEDLQEGRR